MEQDCVFNKNCHRDALIGLAKVSRLPARAGRRNLTAEIEPPAQSVLFNRACLG